MIETDFRLIVMSKLSGVTIAAFCKRIDESSYEELSEWLNSLLGISEPGSHVRPLMQRILTVMNNRWYDAAEEGMYAGMGDGP